MPRLRPLLMVVLCLLCSAFEWPGRVDRLVRELERGDAEARKAAARQLGQFSEDAAAEALLKALEDDDLGVRIEAAQASAHARVRRAVPILRDWLHDKDAGLRRAAVSSLGLLRAPHAEADIVRALGDASPEVRVAAVDALRESGSRDAVVPLLGRLEDSDPLVRGAALRALATLRDERAVMPLLTQLLDSSPELASRAAAALGAIGDVRAAAPLASALHSGPVEVRVAAASALLRLRDPSTVPALDAAARDPEAVVARAAIAALGRIVDPAARAALLDKLGALHGPAVADALVEQARALRAAAQSKDSAALGELNALIAALAAHTSQEAKDDASSNAIKVLARIGKLAPIDAAVPALVTLLRSAPDALRPSVLRALATSDEDSARIALLEQLSSSARSHGPEPELLDALSEQLGRAFARGAPDGRAADPLLDALHAADPKLLVRLVQLLGLTGAQRAADALAPLLEADSAALRAAAATALGRVGDEASAPLLLARLSDQDEAVRRSAAIALRAIGGRDSASALLDLLESKTIEAPSSKQPSSLASAGVAARSEAALTALGGVLARMEAEHEVPESLADRAFTLLTRRVVSRDPMIADRALDALATWGPSNAIVFLGQLLRTPSTRTRALVTAAIGRLRHEDTRQVLRYVLDQGGTRAAVAACVALAEIGDQRDLGALVRTAQRKSWPLPAAATYAIAKIAVRGAIKPQLARRTLCDLGESREPYVRANVAAGLAMLDVSPCGEGGPDPIAWLTNAASPSVRYAAARWTQAGLVSERLDDKAALAALDDCALQDPDPRVRAVCRGEDVLPGPAAATELIVQASPADAQASAPPVIDSLIALRAPSGMVLIGYTDRRGELNAGQVMPGAVVVESPASAPLEAPSPAALADKPQAPSVDEGASEP